MKFPWDFICSSGGLLPHKRSSLKLSSPAGRLPSQKAKKSYLQSVSFSMSSSSMSTPMRWPGLVSILQVHLSFELYFRSGQPGDVSEVHSWTFIVSTSLPHESSLHFLPSSCRTYPWLHSHFYISKNTFINFFSNLSK